MELFKSSVRLLGTPTDVPCDRAHAFLRCPSQRNTSASRVDEASLRPGTSSPPPRGNGSAAAAVRNHDKDGAVLAHGPHEVSAGAIDGKSLHSVARVGNGRTVDS